MDDYTPFCSYIDDLSLEEWEQDYIDKKLNEKFVLPSDVQPYGRNLNPLQNPERRLRKQGGSVVRDANVIGTSTWLEIDNGNKQFTLRTTIQFLDVVGRSSIFPDKEQQLNYAYGAYLEDPERLETSMTIEGVFLPENPQDMDLDAANHFPNIWERITRWTSRSQTRMFSLHWQGLVVLLVFFNGIAHVFDREPDIQEITRPCLIVFNHTTRVKDKATGVVYSGYGACREYLINFFAGALLTGQVPADARSIKFKLTEHPYR